MTVTPMPTARCPRRCRTTTLPEGCSAPGPTGALFLFGRRRVRPGGLAGNGPHRTGRSATDLGHILRGFHHLGIPPFDLPSFDLPAWDPVGDTRARITDAEVLNDANREFLLDWCHRLEPQTAALNQAGVLGGAIARCRRACAATRSKP
jgi:hypothetical protein